MRIFRSPTVFPMGMRRDIIVVLEVLKVMKVLLIEDYAGHFKLVLNYVYASVTNAFDAESAQRDAIERVRYGSISL